MICGRWLRRISALIVVLAVLLSGCASIPTTGPVEQVSDAPETSSGPRIVIAPAPPVANASPNLILAGFLDALSSTASNRFEVARQYLTPEAAETWDPTRGVTVYDGDAHPPVVTDKSAVLTAPVVGRVNADYHYHAVYEPDVQFNFQMTNVSGQWRIGNPGEGVLLSRYQFNRSYRRWPVYFLDSEGKRLVADYILVNAGDASPTTVVQSLVKGPDPWLSPAVTTAVPAETKLAVSTVSVDKAGVASIAMTEQVSALTADQRRSLAAQLLCTLYSFQATITALIITVNGQPLAIPGSDAQQAIHIDQVVPFLDDTMPSVSSALVIADHRIGLLNPDGSFGPFAGSPDTRTWVDDVGSFAVNGDGRQIAYVDSTGTKLFGIAAGSAEPTLLYTGTALARPQIDRSGNLWVIDSRQQAPVLILVDSTGQQTQVPLPDLAGSTVTAFRISSDRTRMGVVATWPGTATNTLGLLRIRSADTLTVDGWAPLTLAGSRGQLTDFRDVGWAAAGTLLVIGYTEEDAHFSVYATDCLGADIQAIGQSADVDPIQLASLHRADGFSAVTLTGSGRVQRYEASSRWSDALDGASAIAFAS